MKHFITMMFFVFYFSINSVYAGAGENICFSDAKIISVSLGYVGYSGDECPDKGNCISFEYEKDGLTKKSYIQGYNNLNDGPKGMAFYDLLKTAMILKYKVTGWSYDDKCNGSSPQVDGVKITTK
ncbi:hypothetical protein D781_3861 [Serratia sp. FGI94]|nr:hypothetical protein D781_3861 [Serratia sp. FGI94]